VAVVVSVLAVVISSGLRAWFFIRGQREFMMDGRSAIKRMVKEIRRVKDPADGLLTFNSGALRFRDIDEQEIIYTQSGVDLTRNGAILLSSLKSPGGMTFSYLDSLGQPTASRESVRLIRIDLFITEGENQVRLRGSAGVRNR
jgi:hypothetical protein